MASLQQRKLVHKQFNSPIGLYSDNNVKATLNRDLKMMSNGAMGIEFDESAKPEHLANSAVLKMLEEEEQQKRGGGLKRVAWPPQEYQSPSRVVPHPVTQHQPSPAPAGIHQVDSSNYHHQPTPQTTQHYQQHQHQPLQQSPHPHYPTESRHTSQAPAPQTHPTLYAQQQQYRESRSREPQAIYQRQHSQPPRQQSIGRNQTPQRHFPNADPTFLGSHDTPDYLAPTAQADVRASSPYTTAFAGGLAVKPGQTTQQFQQPQQQPEYVYQVPQSGGHQNGGNHPVSSAPPSDLLGWSPVKPATPVHLGYTQSPPIQQQPQYQQEPPQPQFHQQHQQPHFQQQPNHQQYQAPVAQSQPMYGDQYGGAAQYGQQNQAYPQQVANEQQQRYQSPQPHYQQQQPQQHQQHQQPQYPSALQQSQADHYRQPSPGVITLRKEAPVSQHSAPVYASEPAAARFGGGTNMRGDQKWPPQEYKQSEVDNVERRKLALGPVFRPRRVQKDYSQFFGQHALNATYPSYRVPPGTQHMTVRY